MGPNIAQSGQNGVTEQLVLPQKLQRMQKQLCMMKQATLDLNGHSPSSEIVFTGLECFRM